MNAEDLKKRTKAFALRVLKLVAALPNTKEGKVLAQSRVTAGSRRQKTNRQSAMMFIRQSAIGNRK